MVYWSHMDRIHLEIEGMHCGGCAVGIQMTTEQLDGVMSAFIDLDGKRGVWEIDGQKVTPEMIIEEILRLGYTATVIEVS
jgi:copper chaperone